MPNLQMSSSGLVFAHLPSQFTVDLKRYHCKLRANCLPKLRFPRTRTTFYNPLVHPLLHPHPPLWSYLEYVCEPRHACHLLVQQAARVSVGVSGRFSVCLSVSVCMSVCLSLSALQTTRYNQADLQTHIQPASLPCARALARVPLVLR